MILCNIFAFVIGRYAIQNHGKGLALPGSNAFILKGFGIPELLATASLGLTNAGVL